MEDLCSSCLCGGRNLYFLEEAKSYNIYLQILSEIPVYNMSAICIRLCWECRAVMHRFMLFKQQVKQSYQQLLKFQDCSQDSSKMSIELQPHLKISILESISYPVEIKLENDNDVNMESNLFMDYGIDITDNKLKTEGNIDDNGTHCEPETFVNDLNVKKVKVKKKLSLKKTKKKVKTSKTNRVIKNVNKKKKTRKKSISDESVDNNASYKYSDDEIVLEKDGDIADKVDEEMIGNIETKELSCANCDKTFVTDIDLDSHINSAHTNKPPDKVNGLAVPVASKRAPRASKEELDSKPHCRECGKQFSSRKTYKYHLSVLHEGQNRYPCPRCGKVYQWKSNLGRHMRSHKARDSGELYCSVCDKRFASIATYKQHLRVSRRHVSENEFTFVCNECGKKFVNKTRLRDHIDWEHLKKIKFVCQLCNKPFKCHTSLYVHMQNVHHNKEKKDNLCHVCGKSYQNAAKLKYHIVAMHTSETPYQCSQCNAAFGWYSSLYRHIREVHYKMKLQVKKSKKSKKLPHDGLSSILPHPTMLPPVHQQGHP